MKPIHYVISLYDLEVNGAFNYQGAVSIDLKLSERASKLSLNATGLKLKSAGINDKKAALINYDEGKQRAELDFLENIDPGSHTLKIDFTGTINHGMAGFYRSLYASKVPPAKSTPTEGSQHVMFSTQFESCDARRAFPCFDEPNLKATFDVNLEIPDDLTALSNMPEKAVTSNKTGYKIVQFERTPIMSTYLLAWAVGDFEFIETYTKRNYNGKPLPVRVYTTRGLKDLGALGLSVCHQVVDHFSEIFNLEYPLPKLDLLAVHEFSHGVRACSSELDFNADCC